MNASNDISQVDAPSGATQRTVLVLGANGRFGAAAAHAFHAAAWQVVAQVRRAAAPDLPPGVTTISAPLSAPAALAAAACGARVVVYAVNPIYTRWDEEALPLLDAGLDVARRLGARFMLPGNVYNFGARMPPLLRADTPQRPTTRKGELRVAMEAAIEEWCRNTGLPANVVRGGDFFGAGTGNWFDQVITRGLASGRLVYPGPLDVMHAWAYLPDFAQAFVAVAEDGATGFSRLHFGGHALTGRELLAAIELAAEELGIAPPRGFRHGDFPWPLVRAAGVVYPLWRELARMSYLWRVPHALDGTALAALPGATQTPLAVALRHTLRGLGYARSLAGLQTAH